MHSKFRRRKGDSMKRIVKLIAANDSVTLDKEVKACVEIINNQGATVVSANTSVAMSRNDRNDEIKYVFVTTLLIDSPEI